MNICLTIPFFLPRYLTTRLGTLTFSKSIHLFLHCEVIIEVGDEI